MHEATPESSSAPRTPFSWVRVLFGSVLALLGGLVSACFTLGLCLYVASRVGGGSPAPGLIGFLLLWAIFGAAPLGLGIWLLRSPGESKRFWNRFMLAVLLLFLAAGADGNFGPNNWRRAFARERLPPSDASKLQRSLITPHVDAPITRGTNLIWCGTFQLAWNEACQLTGGDLKFAGGHPMVAAMNQRLFAKDDLDESSYVALAGLSGEGIHEKIRSAVRDRFRGEFKPRFLPDQKLTPRPQDLVVYACLYKKLPFQMPFQRLEDRLIFDGQRVSAFGFVVGHTNSADLYGQVLVLDYQSADDFIIELKTASQGDRLILAKVQPRTDLHTTLRSVNERVAQSQPQPALTNDVLVVPRMKFDITRVYSEIQGLWLIPQNPQIAKDLLLVSATQNILFEMNERGAELRSEAQLSFGCAAHILPEPKHRMIFDKPFLLLMQRHDAKFPYLAVWVDNPEILISR